MWSFLVYFCESVNKNIFEWVSTIYILNEDKDGLTETGLLWMENVSTILKQENDYKMTNLCIEIRFVYKIIGKIK